MSFFHILKQNNLDFNKAKEIFYGLTDVQIAWLNGASQRAAAEADSEASKEEARKKTNKFGEGRSFDLKG